MNFISIQTPNETPDKWKTCQIIKLEVKQFKNAGSIYVKGIANSNCVTTLISINDFNSLINGKIVTSLHGYFKLKLDSEPTKDWFKQAFKICV